MLLLTAGLGYVSYNIAEEYIGLYGAQENKVVVEKMQTIADRMYDDEIKRKESLGIDIKLIQGSLSINEEFQKQTFDPLPLLEIIGAELGQLRVDNLVLNGPLPTTFAIDPMAQQAGSAAPPLRTIAINLKFSFPGTVKPEIGNVRLEDLRQAIAAKLDKSYTVTVSKQLADLTYKGKLTDETGFSAVKRTANEIYTGEILIQKDIENVADTGTQ